MVTHIQFHRSDDAGVTPDVETMFTGEPAVNLADKKFWVKGASGELITLIDGPTGPFGALVVDGTTQKADVESKLGFSAGANIALGLSNVGNEKRITISSSDRASTIAGSDGEVQFNASDGFSADSGLVYNETANRLGVAVAGGSERVRSTIEAAGVVMAGGFSGATGIFATGITADTIWHEGGLGAALKINVGQHKILDATANLVTINPVNANIDFKVDGDTNDNLLRTDAVNEKIGILAGASPREALEVVGNVMTNAGFSGATGIFATGITLGQGSNYGNIWMPTNGNLRFIIGSENILDIDTGALFHINSSNSRTGFRVDSNKNDHAIFTHPTEGKVGILVGDPQESLHVIGSVQASAGVSGATGVFGTNVGIATKTPREALEVVGTVLATGISAGGGTFDGDVTFSGDVITYGGVTAQDDSTFGGSVTIRNSGDANLYLYADLDDSGETDNPLIQMRQDGTNNNVKIGMGGNASDSAFYTGQLDNAFFIEGLGAVPIQIANNNSAAITVDNSNLVGIKTIAPRESLEVRGNIMTNAGVSGATFEVGNNIKFSDGSTLGTAQKSNIGVFLQTGGPETITTGNKGHRIIPYDCEVTQWTLTAPTSGSVTFDINWCTYANWPNAASVGFASGAVQPALRSATKNQQSLSSGNWTKGTFSEGEIIEFEVDGVSGVTACNLTLHIRSK